MLSILVLLCLFCNPGNGQFSKRFGGTYDLIVTQKVPCGDVGTDQMKFVSNRISLYNRTTKVYNSEVLFPWGITDDINLWIDVWEYGNGGYHKGLMNKELGPFCSALKSFTKNVHKTIARSIGGFKNCPIPPGNYTMKNWPIDIQLTIPVLPYQTTRYDLYFLHRKKRVGCISLKCEIVPKKKKN